MQVLFLGNAGSITAATVAKLGLSDVVKLPGTLPHRVGLQYIVGADLLLLVPGPGKSTMTGKIFEYLAVKKPILALAGEGAVKDLVLGAGLGTVVAPEDVHGIAAALHSLYCEFSNGGHRCFRATDGILKQYDRREIARRMAALFDTN